MNKISQPKSFLGNILFTLGILLGTTLFGGLVWSDVEAIFYGLPQLTNNVLEGVSCPPLMTRSETANLQATIRNKTDRQLATTMRVEISTPAMPQSERVQISLKPGQSTTLTWPVSQENVDLGYFIFAKVYRYPAYQTSLAEATCGILVPNISFLSGRALLALWLGGGLLCTVAGLWILEPKFVIAGQRTNLYAAKRLMAIAMLFGLFLGLQGIWLPGLLMLVIVSLLAIIFFYLTLAK